MTAKILFSIMSLFFLTHANASNQSAFDIENVRCYQFRLEDNPESRADVTNLPIETWCYHKGKNSHDPLFVFNADSKEVKPETSFIVDEEGYITHGSLNAGIVTYHKVKASEFNPFSVPYTEPTNLKPSENPQISNSSAEEVFKVLIKQTQLKPFNFSLSESEVSVFAQASPIPWRGFWWPYKNLPLAFGPTSPLGKYDQYVLAHTSQPTNALGWERSHHFSHGIWWEGHCNGWAASAILRPQPTYSKIDSASGVVFTMADQKGILAETDYCAAVSFYGSRYRGRSTDDRFDVHPPLFHKTIMYYINSLHKTIVIDYHADPAVDNHPVTGYTMNIKKIDAHNFEVTAVLNFHKYDNRKTFPPGLAPMYTRTYRYTLQQNDRGEIVGGLWRSANPDFIWVPLGLKDCDSNNPFMKLDQVQNILNLPPAPGSPIVLFN